MTSPHRTPSYSNSQTIVVDEATHFTPLLVAKAKKALQAIYRPGFVYKKVGIIMNGLVPESCYQPDLLHTPPQEKSRQLKAMLVLDGLNQKRGAGTIRFASEGLRQSWRMKRGTVSARFTTSWDELLTVHI